MTLCTNVQLEETWEQNKVLLCISIKGDIYTILGGFECTRMFIVSI